MAYVITDECVSCGTCAGECPVEAIAEGDSHYEINPDVCVECGTCASVCPTEAINTPTDAQIWISDAQLESKRKQYRKVPTLCVSSVLFSFLTFLHDLMPFS